MVSLLGWNIFLIYQYLINIRLLFLTFWYSNYTFVYPCCNHLISKRNLFEKNNCFVSNFLKTYSSFRPLFFLAFFCKKTTSLLLAQQKIQKYLEGILSFPWKRNAQAALNSLFFRSKSSKRNVLLSKRNVLLKETNKRYEQLCAAFIYCCAYLIQIFLVFFEKSSIRSFYFLLRIDNQRFIWN